MKKLFVLIAVAGLGAACDFWIEYRGRLFTKGEYDKPPPPAA